MIRASGGNLKLDWATSELKAELNPKGELNTRDEAESNQAETPGHPESGGGTARRPIRSLLRKGKVTGGKSEKRRSERWE
jgi:hypothetical protein